MRILRIATIFGLTAFSFSFSSAASAQAPALVLEAIEVSPKQPGSDTLCQLRVTLRNRGERAVYAFGFQVELNDEALAVYDKQLFFRPVAPGEAAELRLFNFWTTENGRERPADGKLRVRVTLKEAQWVEITTEGSGDDPVEVWRPLGEVENLPVQVETLLELAS